MEQNDRGQGLSVMRRGNSSDNVSDCISDAEASACPLDGTASASDMPRVIGTIPAGLAAAPLPGIADLHDDRAFTGILSHFDSGIPFSKDALALRG